MKRVDEIMQELGFKQDAEFSVKKAFIKNLIKQAYGVNVVDDDGFRSENVVALPAQSNDGTNKRNTQQNTLTQQQPTEVPQSKKTTEPQGTKPSMTSSTDGTRGNFLEAQLEFDFFEAI